MLMSTIAAPSISTAPTAVKIVVPMPPVEGSSIPVLFSTLTVLSVKTVLFALTSPSLSMSTVIGDASRL